MELGEFIKLIQSSLENMPQEFYHIITTYEPLGINRERVFCYELYHQMRCIQDNNGMRGIKLHGEIDKRGHDLFRGDAARNPDFIFHVPGTMEGNKVVIEVKGNVEGQNREGVFKDIQTLSKFTDQLHNYELGVMIIYNYSFEEIKQYILKNIKQRIEAEKISIDRIIVFCKKNQDHPVESGYLSSILNEVNNG